MAEVVVDTPIGPLLLVASEGAHTHVWFDGLGRASTDEADLPREDAGVLGAATVQLCEYFAGERRELDALLDQIRNLGPGTSYYAPGRKRDDIL